MIRRVLMKMLAGLAVAANMPMVRASVQPRTVAELESAIESLYAEAKDMRPAAFEEFATVGLDHDKPVYRMVPAMYRRVGESEALIVAAAWRDMQDAAAGFERATLYWRRRPELIREFGNEFSLRFRFGILPVDWEDRARRTSAEERLESWRSKFVPEGAQTPRVRS